ncbi:MAG: hypothetical protein ACLUNQ_06225 [Oscillospiraceae bacterium]
MTPCWTGSTPPWGPSTTALALRTLRARYSGDRQPDLPGDDGLVPPGGDVFSEQLGRCTCIRPAQRQAASPSPPRTSTGPCPWIPKPWRLCCRCSGWAETVQAVDSADLWAGPEHRPAPCTIELTYHAAEYEAAVAAESVPCLHPDGTAAQLPQGSLLVLAQCYDRGDANITLTDAKGLSVRRAAGRGPCGIKYIEKASLSAPMTRTGTFFSMSEKPRRVRGPQAANQV